MADGQKPNLSLDDIWEAEKHRRMEIQEGYAIYKAKVWNVDDAKKINHFLDTRLGFLLIGMVVWIVIVLAFGYQYAVTIAVWSPSRMLLLFSPDVVLFLLVLFILAAGTDFAIAKFNISPMKSGRSTNQKE